ncbi:MAG: hypothetical protein ACXVYI_00325 [Mycobacterium sp.]
MGEQILPDTRNGVAQWMRRTAIAVDLRSAIAFTVTVSAAPWRANAGPADSVFPGMEIRQGSAACTVGYVEPRLRLALTTGQCDGGESRVTDRDGNLVGSVLIARRQNGEAPAGDVSMLPVEYEAIALAPDVTATDRLPSGRNLLSAPSPRAPPGLPVC